MPFDAAMVDTSRLNPPSILSVTELLGGCYRGLEEGLLDKAAWPVEESINAEMTGRELYQVGREFYRNRDYKAASDYWKKAALKNEARAYKRLTRLYDRGEGVAVNKELATLYRACYSTDWRGRVTIKEDSTNEKDQLGVATRRFDLGDYDGARDAYSRHVHHVEVQSETNMIFGFEIFYHLAVKNHRNKRLQLAMNCYQFATDMIITKSPHSQEFQSAALANKALIHFELKEYEQCIESCKVYFKYPSIEPIYRSISERVIDLKALLKLSSVKLIEQQLKEGKILEALSSLEGLSVKEPQDQMISLVLASLYWCDGRYVLAEKYFNACLVGHPGLGDENTILALQGRGEMRRLLGNYEGVVDDAQKILDLDNENVFAYALRADAAFNSGNYEKAKEDFLTGLCLGPENVDVTFMKAGLSILEELMKDPLKLTKHLVYCLGLRLRHVELSQEEQVHLLSSRAAAYRQLIQQEERVLFSKISSKEVQILKAHQQENLRILDDKRNPELLIDRMERWQDRDKKLKTSVPAAIYQRFLAYFDYQAEFLKDLESLQKLGVSTGDIISEIAKLRKELYGEQAVVLSSVRDKGVNGSSSPGTNRSAFHTAAVQAASLPQKETKHRVKFTSL